jgi:phosphoribosylaminoimidazole carboxylase (NCAIR synthetase)
LNTKAVLWWIKHQYASATDYALSDREPQLLCLDAFAPYIGKGKKIPAKESDTAKAKRLAEQEGNMLIKEEFAKLNTTISIIPRGCTGYVQVLDVLVNKIVKLYIEEYEQEYYDNNLDIFAAEKVNIGQR